MDKHEGGFAAVEIALVVVAVAAVGFAGWTWYQAAQTKEASQQMEETEKAETNGVTRKESIDPGEESKVQKAEPAGEASHPSFATGQVRFTDTDDARVAILINNSMRDEPLRAIWAEYSKDKTGIHKNPSTTEKTTSHLAHNTLSNYGGFHATISASELEPGETYFYRAAGETQDGQTIYGGVAAFSARK